jgi:hypothetical protein
MEASSCGAEPAGGLGTLTAPGVLGALGVLGVLEVTVEPFGFSAGTLKSFSSIFGGRGKTGLGSAGLVFGSGAFGIVPVDEGGNRHSSGM